jgi:hypothetical protein
MTFSDKRPAVLKPMLPAPGWKIWSAQRKAALLLAIRAGIISKEEAQKAYSLSEEELAVCQERFEIDGLGGLQSKNEQASRPVTRKAPPAAQLPRLPRQK